ncbi:cytochrome P450 [Epithele typhae]|uniref:cytochrome P450 n=1 Tax=Epithele typhae TaxID=378194 RepID=UPI002007C7C1|nr:cytochrome P450 [Epithele typhae]KAH9924356.1 cytochrome P450 [Epithele typhae]
MPKHRQWEGLAEITEKYGDIVMLRILDQRIVIFGGGGTVLEHLEKTSATTSGRAQSPSFKMSGMTEAFGFMEYGQAWRLRRRLFWQYFNSNAIRKYQEVQREHIHKLAKSLLESTSASPNTSAMSAALLEIVYGLQAREGDETIKVVDIGMQGVRELLLSGTFLVDILPFLQYAPSFKPFRRTFERWRRDLRRMMVLPFERYMAEDPRPECVATDMISGAQRLVKVNMCVYQDLQYHTYISAQTASTLLVFFLAMSLYPEVQMRAQAELDAVVGQNRLPDFSDRPNLPYVNAIVKEVYRWLPVSPLGLPHFTTEDEEMGGYFIPKGTILVSNIWACLRDSEAYENPEEFLPERWIKDGKIDPDVRDSERYLFGFGRRICPGRHFADAAVFVGVGVLLHVFKFCPPLDADGKEIKIKPRLADIFVS